MNSTLPHLSAGPGASSATVAGAQSNAAVLAGLLPSVGAASTGDTIGTRPADFSTFMPANAGATQTMTGAPAPATVTLHAPITPASEGAGDVAVAAPVLQGAPGEMSPKPASTRADDFTSVARPLSPRPTKWTGHDLTADSIANTGTPSWSRGAASTPPATNPPELFSSDITGEASHSNTVPDEIREQAVAFAAALLQSLRPELTPAVQASLVQSTPVPTTEGFTEISTPAVSPMRARAGTAPLPVLPAASEGTEDVMPAEPALTSAGVGEHAAPVIPTNSSPLSAHARPAVAGEGAVEFKLAAPPAPPVAAPSVAGQGTDKSMEFRADLALPGQPVLRVESHGYSSGAQSAATSAAAAPDATRANFAANRSARETRPAAPNNVGERNFESSQGEQLTASPAAAGITVAKPEPAMPATPLEEFRDVRHPHDAMALIGRPEFHLASAPAERTAPPMSGAAAQNLAERAVDTVTNLIDTQFSASMQKSGSVQLHLKFGGEDLSVRVELRDGAVHTAFRTDSAPLRAALQREWQAVTATSPEQLHRFAEPVFSPGSNSSNSFAQGDARQQPQHQAQPDGQQRAPRDSFSDHPAFNRRSLFSETFVPEPPTPRVAAFLPTSVRLSALA